LLSSFFLTGEKPAFSNNYSHMKKPNWMLLFLMLAGPLATQAQKDSIPTVTTDNGKLYLFNESMIDDESDESQNVSSMLTNSSDVFTSNAGYAFSAMRFRVRGLDSEYAQSSINGITFNDQERGRFSYSMLGGLNDVVRNREDVTATDYNSFGYGDIGGASNILMMASKYNPGSRVSLAYTNRNYKIRGTYTYSTGLMSNGWAFTGAIGYRWADEGYGEGTFYNSLGYFAALEKVLNSKHSFSLTTFGAPTQRGNQSASTQELYDLVGTHTYNSNWGWQDGQKRNSRIVTSYEPVIILTHLWTPDKNTKLTTGLAARSSSYGSTAIAYNNAPNPNPAYYRNLPSYQTTDEMKELYTSLWTSGDESQTQIDWDRLYMANSLAAKEGQSARYILEERHNDQNEAMFNSTLNKRLNDNIKVTGGVEARYTKGMHYKTIADMLGASTYSDVDQYTENYSPLNPNIQYNDLNATTTEKKKGDIFGYNYNIKVSSANAWFQNSHNYNHLDFYYGAKLSVMSYFREGLMKNGRAPLNSYGKGQVHDFFNQSVKAGLTWKVNGNHFFSANVLAENTPTLSNNAYISPRIKDDAIPDLGNGTTLHMDVNYKFNSRVFRGRITAFNTFLNNQVEIDNFYNDELMTFVNYAMTGVNKVHQGFEVGLAAKLTSQLTATFLGSVADCYYNNHPTATMSTENGMQEDVVRTVYLKNYKVGGTPQTALSLEFDYAAPGYWFFNLGCSYYDRNYVELSPIRHTAEILDFTADSEEAYMALAKKITEQEKFDAGYMVDASIGKSIRLKNGNLVNFNLQFANLLNNTTLRTGGYQQGRFDYTNYNVDKFPSYYYYAQGFNCYFLVSYKF
jgi:hypothetical protein